MVPVTIVVSVLAVLLGMGCSASCQGIPGCYPVPYPTAGSCETRPPVQSTVRTVQVDVPVPCSPAMGCTPAAACAPYGCCRPPCPAPCPPQPVKVQVEVVVRPEAPKPCAPQTFCCENPPVFEPIFYHAAWMLRSMVLAPLGLGECILGHGMPCQACPRPTPLSCPPRQISPCGPPASTFSAAPPVCSPECPRPVRSALAGQPMAQQACCPPRGSFLAKGKNPLPR
jgi:hypothetical protein